MKFLGAGLALGGIALILVAASNMLAQSAGEGMELPPFLPSFVTAYPLPIGFLFIGLGYLMASRDRS